MSTSRFFDAIVTGVLILALAFTSGLYYLSRQDIAVEAMASVQDFPYEELFGQFQVMEIKIELSDADWEDMLSNPLAEEYKQCDVTVNGTLYTDAAIRTKGNTSLSQVASSDSDRYSFKIEFDHYDKNKSMAGLDKLVLNNLFCDATYVKEYIAYDIFRYAGVETPFYAFADITVNGSGFGCYIALEAMEDSFVQRVYGGEGMLYKPESDRAGGPGGGFGQGDRMEPPTDREFTEGMEPPMGGDVPEGMELSVEEGVPEGMEPPMEGDAPEGTKPPMGGDVPEEMELPMESDAPEGMELPMEGEMTERMEHPMNGECSEWAGAPTGGEFADQEEPLAGRELAERTELPEDEEFPGGMELPTDGEPSVGMELVTDGESTEGVKSSEDKSLPEEESLTEGKGRPRDGEMHSQGKRPEGGGRGFDEDETGGGADLAYVDDNPDSYSDIFENASFDVTEEDKQRVIKALQKLNEGEELETYLDVDACLRYFAAQTFIVNLDSYYSNLKHNYYLFEKDGRLTILPWDLNLAFGGFQSRDATEAVNGAIDTPMDGLEEERPLFARLMEVEEYKEQYHYYLNEIADGYVNGGQFSSTLSKVKSVIAPYVEDDATAFYNYQEFLGAIEMLEKFVLLRAESVQKQLAGDIPPESGERSADTVLVDASDISLSVMGTQNGGGAGGRVFP